MSGASLVELVQGLLERTYRPEFSLGDPAPFIIGDSGYRRFYGASGTPGSRLLVRDTDGGLRLAVYYPDELIARLERFPPQRGLGEENVDDFAALVEELDHLLVVAARMRARRSVSLFELELHANVSKHLVLARFLAGGARRLGEARRLWLRHHLFGKVRFVDDDPEVRRRYDDARRFAIRLLDGLARLDRPRRIEALRTFHRAEAAEKLRLIDALAA